MLGKQFLHLFEGDSKNIHTLNRSDGDLFDFEFIKSFVQDIKPDVIIHCLADTNLERCERNQKETLLLHCGLTHCLSSFGSKMVYISTSSVVDPSNFYDKSKLLGEKICLLNNQDNLVIRTNIYGCKSSSGNSLFEWAFRSFNEKKQITGYSDVYFNAIYTKQLVKAIQELLQSKHCGIINIAGDYSISKYDFLKKICKIFDFDESLLKKGKSPASDFVKRSKDITLNIQEAKEKYNICLNLNEGLLELKKDLEKK